MGMDPKTVFVTGASSGLGRGLAVRYARAGATVHAAARRGAELDALAAEVASSGGSGRVVPVLLDVTDTDALVGAIRAAEQAAGGALDLVIANAGVAEPSPATRIDWRAVKHVLDVNVSAACVTIAAALPAMVERRKGTVVAIGSLAGFRGLPGSGAYCASKAALHTFMESMRVDLHGTGVIAVTISPGFVKTEITARSRFPMPFVMELEDAVEIMFRAIARGAPVVCFPLPLAALSVVLRIVPRALYERLARGWRGRGARSTPRP